MAEQFLAYGGRAVITFHAGKHYYSVGIPALGITRLYQPGVTTILGLKDKSAPLMSWAVKQMSCRVKELLVTAPDPLPKNILAAYLDAAQDTYRDAKQEAADISSLVHRVLEQALLGNFDESMLPLEANALLAPNLTPDMVELANNAIRAGLRFFKKYEITVLETEQPRWSPTWGFIGTGDLIALIDNELAILDFKTSSGIYSEMFLQTAAYQVAYEEEHPDQQILKRWIVRVGKDGKLVEATRGRDTLNDDFVCFRALKKVWEWDRINGRWPKEAVPIIGNLDAAIAKAGKVA
jgi:hypothetical protein